MVATMGRVRVLVMKIYIAVTLLLLSQLSCASADKIVAGDEKKVAIIGGGIAGTFAARYLAEFDAPCILAAVDLFDPSPQLTGAQLNPSGGNYSGIGWQGPRVSTLTLEDGSTVELGASIIFAGNRIITEQVDADPSLEKAPPGSTGKEAASDPGGFGVYEGNGIWDLIVRDDEPDWKVALRLAWRYNFDLVKMRNAVKSAFASFESVYALLDDSSTFRSPDDIWKAAGLYETTTMSFEEYLDTIGISGSQAMRATKSSGVEWSWWRAAMTEFTLAWDSISRLLLPGHGSLRRELLDAVNINNYNQNSSQLDGLAGLVSFIPTQGDIYCIRGGNGQILSSVFRRAKEIRAASKCSSEIRESIRATDNGSGSSIFRHVQAKVTTVVFANDKVEIWGNSNADSNGASANDDPVILGVYDVVILAAPLQHAGIQFKTKVTGGVANSVKLDGLTKKSVNVSSGDELTPSSANRTYAQTVTTIVSNATLVHESFGFLAGEIVPRAVSVTARGKREEGFSALSRLSGTDGVVDGVFKIFSAEPLTKERLSYWFGSRYVVTHQKVWGGPRGGAYPDFAGGGEAVRSVPFLLHGDKEGDGPALYYANAIEATVSAMEISAIGAKAVVKLAAQRLGMVGRSKGQEQTG